MSIKVTVIVFSSLLGPLSPVVATANDIYGYVDANGVHHYSNVPDSSRYKLVLRDPDAYKLKPNPRNRLGGNDNQAPAGHIGPTSIENDKQSDVVFDVRQPYGEIIKREAELNRLDPFLVAAVITVESNHNRVARSPKGAAGLMQLMPDTAKRYGVADPYQPEGNIRGGTRYLRDLLALFNGDIRLALAGYNAGENAVIRYGNRIPPYPETQDYVPKVLKRYEALRKAI